MGLTTKKLIITLNTSSLNSLNTSGQSLIIFKSVQNSDKSTRPLIWGKVSQFSPILNIDYTCDVGIFTSTTTTIQINKPTTIGFKNIAKWREVFSFTKNTGGAGIFRTGAPKDTIGFTNATGKAFICGLTQTINGQINPYCAAPIAGMENNSFEKREQLLLGLTSQPVNIGEYISNLSPYKTMQTINNQCQNFVTSNQLLHIDMANTNSRKVAYDINKGWSYGHNIWGKTYPSDTDLTSILIT